MVVSLGPTKEVRTRFGPAKVCRAIIEDETGAIVLNLWRDQVSMVRAGEWISPENAFVRAFAEKLELNVRKDGRITILK